MAVPLLYTSGFRWYAILFSMTPLLHLVITYRYWILFPVALFEGPVLAMTTGILIKLGYLDPFLTYGIFVLCDYLPDTMFYYIGKYGIKTKFIQKYIAKFKILSNNLPLIEKLWRDHPKKTMFMSKLAYGITPTFLISAGTTGMSYGRFVAYALPVTLIQYGVFLTLGYYLGYSYTAISGYVQYTGYLITAVLIIFVALYIMFQKYMAKKVQAMEEAEKGAE